MGHEYQTNHVITGDLNIIKNTSLEMFAKGPKYREPKPVPTFDHTLFEYLFCVFRTFLVLIK
jgi:hypothetical protein